MKTSEAIAAFQTIQALIDDPAPKAVKFNFALIKNRRALDIIVQQYNAKIAEQDDPIFNELIRRWRELALPHAELNDDGSLARDNNGNIVITPDHVIEYNLACEDVLLERQEHQDSFNRRNALIAELNDVEVDIHFYPIPLSLFPAETEFKTLEILYPMIDGDH